MYKSALQVWLKIQSFVIL